MTKKTLQELVSNIKPNTDWLNRYVHSVPLFIEEAAQGFKWDKDNDVFWQYFFESHHCAGSIGQGDFEHKERAQIQAHWDQIAPLLTKIAQNQKTPDFAVYAQLAKMIREYTRNNKMAATRRMVASLQPQLLSTMYSNTKFYALYQFIRNHVERGDALSKYGSWFQKSHELFKFFEKEIDVGPLDFTNLIHNNLSPELLNSMKLMTLPWQVFEAIDHQQPISETLLKDNPMIAKITDILVNHKPQIILQGPPGTGKTHTAKDVAEQLIFAELSDKEDQKERLANSDQFELIQFHPSYSYEDFVQKIAVDIDEQTRQPKYSVEACILMEFAARALKNHEDHYKTSEKLSLEEKFNNEFSQFTESLQEEIDQAKNSFKFDNSVCAIAAIDDTTIIIVGTSSFRIRLKIEDIKTSYLAGDTTRQQIKQNSKISRTAWQFATYVERILTMFRDSGYIKDAVQTVAQPKLKKYVLVIDEINRANLATVLGELIYGLEYRGESIKPLYGNNEDNNKLVLPPNLYIIGTMNTADRSVGSMDYAIRRRFAFFNVLPTKLESEEIDFDFETFDKVSLLFVKTLDDQTKQFGQTLERSEHLSEEFNPEDVWIGHSYFIYKSEKNRHYKITYELIPLVQEYIKDGILKESAHEVLKTLLPQGL